MELTKDDIQNLISIGQTDSIDAKDLFLYFRQRDFINCLHWQSWREYSTDLNDAEIIDLFKGLVKTESDLKWIGGSVAGAIWIYRIIQERGLDSDRVIADFGFRNCDNPYIPFGSSYYGKRTSKDYFAFKEEKSKIRASKAVRYDKVLKRVEGRKLKRINAIAELRHLSNGHRRQIRSELIKSYSLATAQEKLEIIAADLKFPPEYYPPEWIDIAKEEIEKLPVELIKKLYDKLSSKTKGHWKRFAHKLEQLDDGL